MKKLIMILLALGTTAAFAQTGYNAYHGGNGGYTNYNGGQTHYQPAPVQTNVVYTTPANCGPGYGNGYGNACQTRTRYEWSPCGTFQYCVQETSYWIPGQWVYTNGCRTWNDGYTGWRCNSRTRYVPVRGCAAPATVVYQGGVSNGPGYGNGHGGGYGGGHGGGYGGGHGHGGGRGYR